MSCIQHHGVQTIRPDTLKTKSTRIIHKIEVCSFREPFLLPQPPKCYGVTCLAAFFFGGGGPHVALGSCAEDDLDLLRPLLPSAPISALGLQVCTIKPSLFNTEDQTEGIGRQSRKASTPPTEPHLQTCFSSSQSTSCS